VQDPELVLRLMKESQRKIKPDSNTAQVSLCKNIRPWRGAPTWNSKKWAMATTRDPEAEPNQKHQT